MTVSTRGRPHRYRPVALFATLVLTLAGCAGTTDTTSPVTERSDETSAATTAPATSPTDTAEVPTTTSSSTGSRYAVLDLDGWELRGAVDYETDPDFGDHTDWWAEHERFGPVDDNGNFEGVSVRLSGHSVAVDDLADTLTDYGFVFTRAPAGPDRVAGAGRNNGPNVVIWSLTDDYALMVLSYELDTTELAELADTSRPVSTEDWTSAGGEILPCLPGSQGCDFVAKLD